MILQSVSSTSLLRCVIRYPSKSSIIVPIRKIYNSKIRFRQNEDVQQFTVDEFLRNESSSSSVINEPYLLERINSISAEAFIQQFDSKVKINTIENYVTKLIQANDFKKIWHIANLMVEHQIQPSINMYVLLLQVCSLTNKPEGARMAVGLYFEAMRLLESNPGKQTRTRSVHGSLAYYFLLSFQSCDDFTDLLSLKILWENYTMHNADKPIYELLYHSAYINTLLNTTQNQMALDHFEKAFHELTTTDTKDKYHQFNKYEVLITLPTIRVLDIMLSSKDCNGLQKWLQIISDVQQENNGENSKYKKDIINNKNWLKYLNRGLLDNNYDLVKCVYDKFIMKDFSEGITAEDILFKNKSTSFPSSIGMASINDETIYQILHTFSINGDVNLTLGLIESHYIHKTMKGEKALTKELCLKIIESYCYHPDLQSSWTENEVNNINDSNDESVKRVLDVLNNFVIKFEKNSEKNISYRDITDAMSFKFVNYKVYDNNIRKAIAKNLEIAEKIKNPDDEDKVPGLPRKISNTNLDNSQRGNVLANLGTLSYFISEHFTYLLHDKKYSKSTITLFINCILNHTNLYQNFSGTVKALSSIKKIIPNMVNNYLNDDLFNIILNSLSNSNSAKIASFILFNYMRNKQKLSHDHYRCIISALLRGNFHESIQYVLYNYLKDYNGVIDPKILQLLLDLPLDIIHNNESTTSLIAFIQDRTVTDMKIDAEVPLLSVREIDDFWSATKLCNHEPIINDENLAGFKRPYNYLFDIRDSHYLRYIFDLSSHSDDSLH